MPTFITFKRWSLKRPGTESAVVALVREAIIPHYQKLPDCRKLGLLRIEGTNTYLATQHWVNKAVREEVLASPAYARWSEEYEPILEQWFALMEFEAEWEAADLLTSD
jgi:hypothetical protein